jgi:hypothetical protein
MKRSESITEIAKALNEFQKDLEQPAKDASNPFFNAKYVPLPSVIKVIKQYATPHGLSYTQMPITQDNKTGVQTIIFHTSGEFIEYEPLLLPMDKQTAQGAGSAITYSRRYSLAAAFGIDSDADDDGNSASGNDNQSKQQNNNYNRSNDQSNNNNSQGGNSSGKKATDGQVKFINNLIADMMKATGADRNKTKSALEAKQDIGKFGSVKEMTVGQASAAIKFMQEYLKNNGQQNNNQQQSNNQQSSQQSEQQNNDPFKDKGEPIDISDDDLPF